MANVDAGQVCQGKRLERGDGDDQKPINSSFNGLMFCCLLVIKFAGHLETIRAVQSPETSAEGLSK